LGINNPVGAPLLSVIMLETVGKPQAARCPCQAVLGRLAGGLPAASPGGVVTTLQFALAVRDWEI
jgi:hypothetical protein